MGNLVIQTAFIGDALLSIPLIRALRRFQPDARISFVCRKPVGDFFLKTGLVDEVFEVDKTSARSWEAIKAQLRERRFHLVISPHESFRTARLVQGLQADLTIGFYEWWNFFAFDERLTKPTALPDALRQLALLTRADPSLQAPLRAFSKKWLAQKSSQDSQPGWPQAMGLMPSWASMELDDSCFQSSEKIETLLARLMKTSKDVVFIAPGSVWKTKMWSKEGFIEVGRHYQSRRAQVVLVGAGAEKSLCQEIAASIRGSIDLSTQTSLYELAQLFRRGRLLFCNDSGAMHLASVAGLPTVAMFGPTTLNLGYRPWNKNSFVVQTPLECRPCGRHGGNKCPIGTHECMKSLTPAQVTEAAGEVMGRLTV